MNVEAFAAEHPRILRMATSITRDPEAAQDLAQELYLKLIVIHRDKGDLQHICHNGKPNLSWCYTVMMNIFISAKRKDKETEQLTDNEQQPADTLEARFEKDAKISAIWSVIGQLNKGKATAYECRYLLYYVSTGKSLREIAKENNTSMWVVQNAINNARTRIKTIIDGQLNNADY